MYRLKLVARPSSRGAELTSESVVVTIRTARCKI